jgi:hypothetical protein
VEKRQTTIICFVIKSCQEEVVEEGLMSVILLIEGDQ